MITENPITNPLIIGTYSSICVNEVVDYLDQNVMILFLSEYAQHFDFSLFFVKRIRKEKLSIN